MRLEGFKPAGNQVLAKVKYHTLSASGLIMTAPQRDMFAEVMAVGPTAQATKVGDFIMFGDISVLELPFKHKGSNINCVLANEFQILAYYTPESGESRIFVPSAVGSTPLDENGIEFIGNDRPGVWAKENEELFN